MRLRYGKKICTAAGGVELGFEPQDSGPRVHAFNPYSKPINKIHLNKMDRIFLGDKTFMTVSCSCFFFFEKSSLINSKCILCEILWKYFFKSLNRITQSPFIPYIFFQSSSTIDLVGDISP